jgi:hypothetical protein
MVTKNLAIETYGDQKLSNKNLATKILATK